MSASKIRGILSISIVLVFLLVTAIIALAPVLGGYPVEPFREHLKDWGSIYSGIVGIIIGFYFPKSAE
jgi:hypothetical protein